MLHDGTKSIGNEWEMIIHEKHLHWGINHLRWKMNGDYAFTLGNVWGIQQLRWGMSGNEHLRWK